MPKTCKDLERGKKHVNSQKGISPSMFSTVSFFHC